MRSPVRPLPEAIERWVSLARWLRAADLLTAWGGVWGILVWSFPHADGLVQASIAAIVVGAGACLGGVRLRWRPVTGWIGLTVSRRLRPGDRAWCVTPGDVSLVLVTGRRRLRMVITGAPGGPAETLPVRRTRVLLVPADRP